jgi:hypothetical protein
MIQLVSSGLSKNNVRAYVPAYMLVIAALVALEDWQND